MQHLLDKGIPCAIYQFLYMLKSIFGWKV
jgi:hypothetical protein